ncbi:hypothetical protein RF644_07345 [Kocuria sp. CPCC 205258]|uniref:hypothetical protein n=1 Tax=Kocuria sp. CPCC 205258 TaxID=3073552 RepID=UPI0034D6E43A
MTTTSSSSSAPTVVVVGHSYGGSVLSEAADDAPGVTALVDIASFRLAPGESTAELAGRSPGGELGGALEPHLLPGGREISDLYLRPELFRTVPPVRGGSRAWSEGQCSPHCRCRRRREPAAGEDLETEVAVELVEPLGGVVRPHLCPRPSGCIKPGARRRGEAVARQREDGEASRPSGGPA